jgi:PhoPQ-activated pathogenicity-related protein
MPGTRFRFPRWFAALSLLLLCGCSHAAPRTPAAPAVPTALDEYVARDEPNYKWEKIGEEDNAQNRVTVLKLTSQTWQGGDWTHRVEIIRPQKNDFPDTALLLVSYGSPAESLAAQLLARQAGATVINVANVPNQPLFGKNEDALIAYTFQKFLETGDTTWPLLLPMTKSVVKAMDAAQEYSAQELDKPITKFVVGGASKRGWTSWLVAAADSKLHPGRVTGIIPLVYNNLNIPAQLPHELESWGEYSPMIADYTKLGLQDQTSARGKQLIAIVDPYSYRDRFTMPKLLINGTNDPYWTPDATQFYFDQLPRSFVSTALYWAPNSGHDLGNDYPNVLSTAAAWFRLVASGKNIPQVKLSGPIVSPFNGEHDFLIRLSFVQQTFKGIKVWAATSPTRDFRNATWEASTPELNSGQYALRPPKIEKPNYYAAAFVEIEFAGDIPLRLSSPIQIWSADQAGH